MLDALFFYAFASLAVLGSLAMVGFVRNGVAGALSFAIALVSLAGIYLLLDAHLVAVIQIIVYAGAILMLFLFVIMLLDLREDAFASMRGGPALVRGAAALTFVGFVAVWVRSLPRSTLPASLPEGFGGYRVIGRVLYTDYAVPVEVVGLVLLAAVVGAIVLARRSPS